MMLAVAAAIASCALHEPGMRAYPAAITSVYDGDTVTADIDLGLGLWRRGERLRLYGVNAPELRGRQRIDGLIARDWLRARILGKSLTLITIRDARGKYGRLLAILCDDKGDVIADMIDAGLAKPAQY